MCSVNDVEDEVNVITEHATKLPKECVKCGEKALHVVGTNGSFCSDCFDKYFSHKFRASMGKNPIVRNGDRVLIAYSGGISSSALLHLIKQGLCPTTQRKLKFIPGIIFIDERAVVCNDVYSNSIREIETVITESGFPSYIVKLEEVFFAGSTTGIVCTAANARENLVAMLKSTASLTGKLELVYRLRCQLLSFKAKQLNFKHVFLAENSTRLAIAILSNVAQGRGAHLSQDTGFSDCQRFEDCGGVNLLRPMRDITAKEIVMYNSIHKVKTIFLPNLSTKMDSTSSIPNLTEAFVQGLARNFPSTEMTVYRISNKIRPRDNNSCDSNLKCNLCLGYLDNNKETVGASARKDLLFTESLLTDGMKADDVDMRVVSAELSNSDVCRNFDVCYSCSLVLKENKNLPCLSSLPYSSDSKQKRKELVILNKIKEFHVDE